MTNAPLVNESPPSAEERLAVFSSLTPPCKVVKINDLITPDSLVVVYIFVCVCVCVCLKSH